MLGGILSKEAKLFMENARKRMGELNITAADLARRLDVPASNVSMYLKGDRRPKEETLQRYADALECEADWLIGRSPSDTLRIREMSSEELLGQVIQRWDISEERKEALTLLLTDDEDLLKTIMGGLKPFLKAARKAKDVSVG